MAAPYWFREKKIVLPSMGWSSFSLSATRSHQRTAQQPKKSSRTAIKIYWEKDEPPRQNIHMVISNKQGRLYTTYPLKNTYDCERVSPIRHSNFRPRTEHDRGKDMYYRSLLHILVPMSERPPLFRGNVNFNALHRWFHFLVYIFFISLYFVNIVTFKIADSS